LLSKYHTRDANCPERIGVIKAILDLTIKLELSNKEVSAEEYHNGLQLNAEVSGKAMALYNIREVFVQQSDKVKRKF
jgi:hypothetical protein